MAGRFVANCPISRPITIAHQPDVDLNGFMWSYTVGLMFPPQAAYIMTQVPIVPPSTPQ